MGDSERSWKRMYAHLSGAVAVKLMLIAGGYFLGDFLDHRFGTSPWMMVLFILLGTGFGLWWVLRVLD